jgi:hypothetical protein
VFPVRYELNILYCDMRPDSQNNPLQDNGSLTHVSVTSRKKTFSRQRFGKHLLKAGIEKADRELSILLGNCSCIPKTTHS